MGAQGADEEKPRGGTQLSLHFGGEISSLHFFLLDFTWKERIYLICPHLFDKMRKKQSF